MARLEAIAKALYYPTPDRVVGMIGDVVRLEDSEGAALLDPCAGEGRAAAILAHRWSVASHGIELHRERAAACATVLSWAKHGSYHQLASLGEGGKPLDPDHYAPVPASRPFGILFLNPPYDAGAGERQEIEFLRATTRFLAPGGLLVFVPPRHILRSEVFREFMRRHYTNIVAYAFPSPDVEAFDQTVVLATRGSTTYGYGNIDVLEGEFAPLDEAPPYFIKVPVIRARIELVGRAPETYAPDPEGHAWASQQWLMHTGEGAAHELAPLVAPRPGHQAMLLAAGALNGLEIGAANGPGRGILVKGGSRKVTTEIKSKEETIQRERISSYLSVLDLATGELDSWEVDSDTKKTADWFAQHGDALAAGILRAHAPQFTAFDLSFYDFEGLTAPGILPGRSEPEILDVQREAAAAVVHRWRHHKSAILCGEMGTGKTTMGVVACELAGARKVVIICPTHLTKKWAREAETITGERGVAVVAKKLSDVDAFFGDPRARYLVVSKETAKLGARWKPAAAKRTQIIQREVKLRSTSWPYEERGSKMVSEQRTFDACPHCGDEVAVSEKTQGKCMKPNGTPGCGSPLWQFVPITAKGTKRWPLAAYIHDRYARRFHLVVDEAHQHAKGETDQARAVHQLMSAARKIVMMTGTLYGGRASSIFYLLHRLDPLFRRAYKHTDCATFVEHHGLFETVHKEEERTSTYGYRKGNTGGRIREIPGMSPAMIPMLLPYTVFVKLRDLRLELPDYREEVLIVEPEARVRAAAEKFQGDLKGIIREHPQILGAYLQACLGYPDRPDQREEIWDTDEDGEPTELLASAPAIEGDLWPKDETLVELARTEKAAGRKVLVCFAQTQRRDARPRVRAALEAAGLKVVQLDASVPPEKREDWMRERVAEGFDVMLTNGRLVETGLDLLFANTIVQYSIEYSVATLRQSVRRSWRLGQTKPVRVVFMAYANTMQATAMDLIARKMRAAELVDGDEAGGLAQFDAGGGNFLLELAHEVLAA